MMDNDDVISTLNDLIETCKDGEEGFRTCAEHATDLQLKQVLSDRARDCASGAAELRELVRAHGGDPERSSSLGSALHRRWVDIKATLTGPDDEAILNECERGEDVAVRSYGNALDQALPPDVRNVVENQYQGVLRNHEQIKRLRDQVRMQGSARR
jgi:uncharacterized protein (TIGR02284 family)